MITSWRVFLINEGISHWVIALSDRFPESSKLSQKSPCQNSDETLSCSQTQFIESEDLIFWQAPRALEAIQILDLMIPTKDRIHIFTTPISYNKPLELRGKKLLNISASSLSHEYARLESIKKDLQLHWVERKNTQITSFKSRVSTSTRSLQALFRESKKHLSLQTFVDEIFADHPNYDELKRRAQRKARMLLHVCCGPDAGGVIRQLKNEFDLTCFWYDPDIQPKEEHDKRLDAFIKVASIEEVPAVIGEYDVDRFFEAIKGLEHTPEKGAKCSNCYDLRLDRSAQEALKGDFDCYATTLAISPHKVQSKLIAFGEWNQKKYGVPYYHRNFMQEDGFKDSVTYSIENEIFRQDYCGCIYSLKDGGPDARSKNPF